MSERRARKCAVPVLTAAGSLLAVAASAASPPAGVSAVPAPVLGKSVNVAPVSGSVYVKPPPGYSLASSADLVAGQALAKGNGFVRLTRARQIPAGSQVDARAGTLRVTTAAATTNGNTFFLAAPARFMVLVPTSFEFRSQFVSKANTRFQSSFDDH